MTKSSYQQATSLFQLFAHPGRLRIMDELRRAPACVCHLQTVLRRPQAYVSQQLRVLREAGIVAAEKEGLNVFYRLVDAQAIQLLEQVLGPGEEATRLPRCPCPHCQAEFGEVECMAGPAGTERTTGIPTQEEQTSQGGSVQPCLDAVEGTLHSPAGHTL